MLATLPSCGSSDSEGSTGGGANQGVSGASAEAGGADSSGAGSSGAPGGRAAVSEAGGRDSALGGAGASGGASNQGGSPAGAGVAGAASSAMPPADVPRSTLLTDLNDAQKGALCDWNMEVIDGYGQVRNCGMGTHIYPVDQAECIRTYFADVCANATVGLFVDCVFAEIPSQGCVYAWDQCHQIYCL